ncbi:zinc-binding dehydrogenase [Nocardia sp. alder85J]|uniref:zinc-binding dehydrogenase n=1 Tax=Nocardia sp. alder85J TaxID=2862949 RepID=UPI001CD3BB39|nr:Zn-dependent alcohol dehydrogenase [Nocardia sp. alder85J]MCX4092377.1 Zn-dependent alcohol dehydrogenase [Nocardia sp. alder85J]
MKAMIVNAIGAGFAPAEVQLADPVGREVVVGIKASGLCHTDLTFSRFEMGVPTPMLLGHEISGVVERIGPDVTDLAVGDHVVACLVQYCGSCDKCLTGHIYQCTRPEATLRTAEQDPRISHDGHAVSQVFGLGGFAQQALIHEAQLVKIPAEVPFPQAALLGCGVVTGAGSVINTAATKPGDTVVIIGAGGVGLNAVSGAVVAGAATIIAVDITAEKLALARRCGATHTVDSSKVDPVQAVLDITGAGADAVFDFVGIPAVTEQALAMTAVGGGLYLIGLVDPTVQFPLAPLALIMSQKRIQGINMGSTTPRHDIPMFARLYLEGRFNLDDLVSRTIALDEVEKGYAALESPDVARVVITSF